jgi:hypothetical protein
MKWRLNLLILLAAIMLVAGLVLYIRSSSGKEAELPLCPEPDPARGISYEEANNLCRTR